MGLTALLPSTRRWARVPRLSKLVDAGLVFADGLLLPELYFGEDDLEPELYFGVEWDELEWLLELGRLLAERLPDE